MALSGGESIDPTKISAFRKIFLIDEDGNPIPPGGGGVGTEADPKFTAWKAADYDVFKPAISDRVKTLEDDAANHYTKTESDSNNTLQTQAITEAYNAAIAVAIGNLQAQGLTQDQIDQIVAAIPPADYVTTATMNVAISQVLTNANGYTDTQIVNVKAELNTAITKVQNMLTTHIGTDGFRWQDFYNSEHRAYIQIAEVKGMLVGDPTVIPAPADPLTVNDGLGGILGVTFANAEDVFCQIYINGELVYDSNGYARVAATKYFMLKNGDTISATNAQTFSYEVFSIDPNSVFATINKEIVDLQNQVKQNKNDILDIKAAIANLQPDVQNTITVVDKDSAVDITDNGTFPVSSTLGGRINGEGYTLLGILNIKLVATGYVDITLVSEREINSVKYQAGQTVRVYDNTALIGGAVPPLVIDVENGDIIKTEGMNNLTFVPYVAKVSA